MEHAIIGTRRKHDRVRLPPCRPAFRPSKLPKDIAKRRRLRQKYSLEETRQLPTSKLQRTFFEIDAERKQRLVAWYKEVDELKNDLMSMEKALKNGLTLDENANDERTLKRRSFQYHPLQMSEEALKSIPLLMRPKPRSLPIEVKNKEKNWKEINSRSMEVLRFRLSDLRNRHNKLPDIGEHYRILVTPDPRPELKALRMRAHIAAITSLDNNNNNGKIIKRKKSESTKHREFAASGLLPDHHTVQSDTGNTMSSYESTFPGNSLPESTEPSEDKEKQNLAGPANDVNRAVKKQRRKVVLQVKKPEVIQRGESRKSKYQFQVEEKVEMVDTGLEPHVSLKDQGDPKKNETPFKNETNIKDDNKLPGLAPIHESSEIITADEIVIDNSEREYYKKRPEFEIVTIDEVKKSRLIRGYDPPEMHMPSDMNKFVFEEGLDETIETIE